MKRLMVIFSLALIVLSDFLVVKAGNKCGKVFVRPVSKIVEVGFVPLKGKEMVAATDVLTGIGAANGIEFSVNSYGNAVFLTAPYSKIKNPMGIIAFFKELPLLPYRVDVEYFSATDKGISVKLKLYKRGIK